MPACPGAALPLADGHPARLRYMGHALMENRHRLVVDGLLTQATGTADHQAAPALLVRHRSAPRGITLGTEKTYDVVEFVGDLRSRSVTPEFARNDHLTTNLVRLPRLLVEAV
jgi:hypothetical protein